MGAEIYELCGKGLRGAPVMCTWAVCLKCRRSTSDGIEQAIIERVSWMRLSKTEIANAQESHTPIAGAQPWTR